MNIDNSFESFDTKRSREMEQWLVGKVGSRRLLFFLKVGE